MTNPDICDPADENVEPNVVKKQRALTKEDRRGSFLSMVFCAGFEETAVELASEYYLKEPTLDETIPKLLEDMAQTRSKKRRKAALEQLYELTDKDHAENRVPMVCSTKACNVLEAFEADLERRDRRTTCLMLNNLSIPVGNKSVMVRWKNGRLIGALLNVVRNAQPEAYLCILCLQNLSSAEECKVPLMSYIPRGGDRNPVRNTSSLLRTLELVLQSFARYTFVQGRKSVEGEAVRYTLCFLRNATTMKNDDHNAETVLATDIPRILLGFLRDSPNPLSRWTLDSVEDSSLIILVNMAQCMGASRKLTELDAQSVLSKLEKRGTGIHSVRASTIRCSLHEHR